MFLSFSFWHRGKNVLRASLNTLEHYPMIPMYHAVSCMSWVCQYCKPEGNISCFLNSEIPNDLLSQLKQPKSRH